MLEFFWFRLIFIILPIAIITAIITSIATHFIFEGVVAIIDYIVLKIQKNKKF